MQNQDNRENPNVSSNVFCNLAKLCGKKTEANVYLLFDVSSSQSNGFNNDAKRGDYLVEAVQRVTKRGVLVIPFGYPKTTRVIRTPYGETTNLYCPQHGGPVPIPLEQFKHDVDRNRFKTATYPVLIQYFFENHFDTKIPCHIAVEFDGDFSEGGLTFVQILEANRHKLDNVKTLTLIFSPHTKNSDMLKLKTTVSSLLEECDSFVEFKAVKLDRKDPNGLRDVLGSLSDSEVHLSKDWFAYRDIAFHRDLVPFNIAKVLRTKFPKMIPRLVDDMIGCLMNKPQLFLSERNVYSKLYATLKLLRDFSVPKTSIKKDVVKQLRDALVAQPSKNQKVRENFNYLITLMEEFPGLSNNILDFTSWATTRNAEKKGMDPRDIQPLIDLMETFKFEDGTVETEFINWLSNYTTTLEKGSPHRDAIKKLMEDARMDPAEAKWSVYRLKEKQVGVLCVDKIFVEQNRSKVMPAIEDGTGISLTNFTLSLMRSVFYQDGKNIIRGTVCVPDFKKCTGPEARVALGQLFSPFGNYSLMGKKLYIALLTILVEDIEVNPHVRGLAVKAALDDEDYTLEMLFKDNEIESIWFSEAMARILFRAIFLFGDRMFPMSKNDPKHAERLTILKAIYKASMHLRRFNSVAKMAKVTREFEVPAENKDNENKNPLCVGAICEVSFKSWMDPDGSKRKDPYPRLPSLVVVRSKNKGRLKCEYFDAPFGSGDTQKIKAKNLTVLTSTPSMRLVVELNQLLIGWRAVDVAGGIASLNARWKDIKHRIAVDNGGQGMVVKSITAPVPCQMLANILPISDEFRKFALSGAGFSQKNIGPFFGKDKFSGDPVEMKAFEFEHQGFTFTLSDDEVNAFQTEYLRNPDFADRIKSSVANPLVTCYLCLEDVFPTETKRLHCGHSFCVTCNPPPEYKKGEFFEPSRHHCAFCPNVWIKRDTDNATFGADFKYDRKQTYRFCQTCAKPFGTQLACGATRADVSDFCETHRPVDAPRQCSGCGATTVRIDGCNHIACPCGAHWCWLCGRGFNEDHYGDEEVPGGIYYHLRHDHGGAFANA